MPVAGISECGVSPHSTPQYFACKKKKLARQSEQNNRYVGYI